MKMIKRIAAIGIALSLLVACAACKKPDASDALNPANESELTVMPDDVSVAPEIPDVPDDGDYESEVGDEIDYGPLRISPSKCDHTGIALEQDIEIFDFDDKNLLALWRSDVDNDDDTGGWYTDPYQTNLYGLVGISDLVGDNIDEKWVLKQANRDYEEKSNVPLVLAFIKDFDIKKEDAKTSLTMGVEEGYDWAYTEEEVDVLYSDDQELFNKTFVSRFSLYHNGKIYTPYWFNHHTVEDMKKAGLPADDLKRLYDEKLLFDSSSLPDLQKSLKSRIYKYYQMMNP